MLEGLVGCFSAILTFAATSPCAEHGHHIVTNFYFARCAGNISPTFTFLPYTLITFTQGVALGWWLFGLSGRLSDTCG